ncbi:MULTISPECIES: SusC/RagA family TonB-linked outer membrane protein [unclassified Chitinophaga]|uniref:SusC/RagA family TonB-linked outer membrane protein n=1 Tax=unclassified Chitinophaga TaxID=2619133 RepID=UPI00300F8628
MIKMLLGYCSSRLPLMVIMIVTDIYCTSPSFGSTLRQTPKVTISANNIPLSIVFRRIHQQTGIIVSNNFDETKLNEKKRVTVNFFQAEINEVMKFLLSDNSNNLLFKVSDKKILIYKNKTTFPKDTISYIYEIIGKITDTEGNAIPGASVKLKNNTHGTISNTDGSFRLTKIERGSIVVISSIGFESKEIIADKKDVLILLKTHTNVLDEKVIIAYGNTTRRLNTGNVSSLKAKDIEKQPVNNPLLALQGRAPGVFIEQSNGLPGGGITVRIQGVNSLSAGRDPFYVIDGVPYISQLLPTTNVIGGSSGTRGTYGNPLAYINTADIESIEVLKDADATAIYGSRAANGAVLITTKKGKVGPTKVNFLFQSGWSKVPHKMNLLNTKEYLEMRHEALKNDGLTISEFDWDLNGTWDTTRDINWQKELIGNTAQQTDAQLSVSGGNAYTQYLFGAGYHKETTVFPGAFSDTKGSVHINLNSNSANQKFRIQVTGFFLFDDNKLPLTDLTTSALTLAPVAPDPYNSNGSINWAPDANGASTYFTNPIAPNELKSSNKTTNLTGNTTLSYEIIPDLTLESSFGYNSLFTNEITRSPASIYPPEFAAFFPNGTVFLTNRITSWIVEPKLGYKRKISKGYLNLLLGGTITQQNNDQQSITASGFNNELVMEDLASATSITGKTINSVYKYNAFYGRITYNWLDKYVLNLTGRRDGSSRFGPENQFHNFGAIGGAWLFSQEPFIQSNLPILSFGKLRASYGTTGNDQIGDYTFMDIYQPIFITGNAYQGIIGLAPNRLTNPYLQWEETKKLQLGIELGFLSDKIILTANYNHNRSNNLLTSSRLTTVTGFTGINLNFPATIQNTGWEFTLTSTNIKKRNFYWSTNFNLTIPKNQLLSYFGKDKNQYIYIGTPVSTIAYFNYSGLNDTTGIYEFIDAKGNHTYSPSDPSDKTVTLNTDPKLYGGLQNTFTYKGLSLDIFFAFTNRSAIDNVTYSLRGLVYPGQFNSGAGNQAAVVIDRWQKKGDKSLLQPYSTGNTGNLDNLLHSNAIVADNSYIRLKNVSLSWQLPDKWKKTLHSQNARVFVNAQNVFTIANCKNLDPESGLSLPPLRVIVIGAQITL